MFFKNHRKATIGRSTRQLGTTYINQPEGKTTMSNRLSTGILFLDALLGGGYEKDAITTIYGPAGSGKTNLSMLAAITCAEQGQKVIYIDTEGGFSVERLKQLSKNHTEILERIIFLTPTTFEEQKKDLEKLKTLADGKIGLIIIDTISMLYRFERKIGEDSGEFNRDLSLQIAQLTEITRKKNIPVLLTNQVYHSFQNNNIKMVGGDILQYGTKCLLELIPLHSNKRKIILRKHRSLPVDTEKLFAIIAEGVEELK